MLTVLTIDESQKWDETVKSFTDYDVYYLSGYVKPFQQNGDGEPLLFYYRDDRIRGINVVMKRDVVRNEYFAQRIAPDTYYDLATPYGYGGFLIEGYKPGDSLADMDRAYTEYCTDHGMISEVCRFHPVLNNYQYGGLLYSEVKSGSTIALDLQSEAVIWDNLKGTCRNRIRKAQKDGVEIAWGQSDSLWAEFEKIYNATMEHDSAASYYFFKNDFYRIFDITLKSNYLLFYATYKDKIISMSIMMFCNGQIHYFLGGTLREYLYLAPVNVLMYKTACWGYRNGCRTMHLGGGLGAQEDSLYVFKKTFNRNTSYSFVLGGKIFDRVKYNRLIDIRREDGNYNENTMYFPQYRG